VEVKRFALFQEELTRVFRLPFAQESLELQYDIQRIEQMVLKLAIAFHLPLEEHLRGTAAALDAVSASEITQR